MVGRREIAMKGLNKLLVVLAIGTLPYVSNINAYEFIMKPQRDHYLYSLTTTLGIF
jgi:hypothetical protein